MRSLERLALVGALAAAVTISGTLNARVKDLAQQRDIYQSRAANWEQDALNWQTEAQEAEAQVADLKNDLEAAQTGPAGFSAVYLGEFNCTAYCSEQYEHICGTGDGITASGAPITADLTVAADQSLLPFGTVIYIEGVGVRVVQDKGSGVQGKHLDVAVPGSHSDAVNWAGYGTHKVWILKGDASNDEG